MIYYLIGIKGAAMGSLAKILYQAGHIVKGVDVADDFYTFENVDGISIENFSNMKLGKSYFYIIGNAFQNHSVTNYIQNMGYKYLNYPLFLTYYFKNRCWICISGTHGKTTTTKMISDLIPNNTSLIGDGSFQIKGKDNFILEACEYKNTFLNYHPDIAVILNVDYDHIDFFKTREDYYNAFVQFSKQSKLCIINGDEFSYRADHVITFGKKLNNDVVFQYEKGKVTILNKQFYLPIIGEKFAYDFVAAYLVAKIMNEKDYKIQQNMDGFIMPRRRLEKKEIHSQIVICDYAHHPNEIKTVFEALKEEYKAKKLICIFEPHTITRLQSFIHEFKTELSKFDCCYLYGLFSSAREAHNLVLERKLYKCLGFQNYDYHTQQQLSKLKDVVICFMGAGTIDSSYDAYLKLLQNIK
ncbi:MAG: hypothetical protein K2I42_05185 [Anaeroplasmataceae bacterium]|nr:hypothetical protein [Anaeroplasmataceae bacterium]